MPLSEEDFLENRFRNRLRSSPISYSVEIANSGLVLGAGTRLARMTGDTAGPRRLALAKDSERIVALLSIAGDQRHGIDSLRSIKAASDDWERGEKALANIRLAQAALPRVADAADAYRLFLAEELLDQGTSPRGLLKALGFDTSTLDLIKYDPAQPRVPVGNGRNSGEWTSGDSASNENRSFKPTVTISEATISQPSSTTNAGAAPDAAAAITASGKTLDVAGGFGEALFAAGEDSAFLASLATLGATIGTGAVLGAIFVPLSNQVTSEDTISSDLDLHYSLDNDAGTLHLTHQSDTGTELVAVAQLGRDGIFFETETGIPIARSVGGSLVFDAASLANEAEDERAKAGAEAGSLSHDETDDNPQLCPDPGPDAPHGASLRAIAYQAQISALNNPQRRLPPGLAVSLNDPATGKRVVFDDCRESDGTMIEAKGPGYARLLRSPYFYDKILPARWRRQAMKQVAAGGQRNLDWFFAERGAADRAKRIFRETEGIQKINVIYFPAVTP